MTDMTDQGRTFGAANPTWRGPRTTRNLRASRRIGQFLTISVVLFAITSFGFVYWITREHNRLAESSSEQMIRGGISALEEKLRTISMDFAIWPDAVIALRNNDRDWIWNNIGISAAVTETTDLMMVAPADGQTPYGWAPGMDAEPSTTLLPEQAVNDMLALIGAIEVSDRRAVSNLVATEDATWMLAAARIVSEDAADDPASDGDISRLIFGFRLSEDLLTALGQDFLIEDLSLAASPSDAGVHIPLMDGAGTVVTNAVWTPPRPGDQILRSVAVPLILALALLTTIALVSSSLLSRSARRLESAMLTAQEASRAKSDFIANISHELRTPMNGVMGLARLLRQTDLNHKQNGMVEMLMTSADTQMRLIGDLLDVSSMEQGRFNLTIAPFSPVSVVSKTCDLFEFEAKEKGLELKLVQTDPEGIQVLGDSERFRQICANLLSNAVKFTDHGQVLVEIKVRRRLGEAIINLTIADTGRGIAREDLDRVFDRFYQSNAGPLGKSAGNGLGLAITKTIVDLMGGSIDVNSAPGKGTEFKVEIGLETAEAEVPREVVAQGG